MIGKCLANQVHERLPKIRFARQVLEEVVEQWTVEHRAREAGISARNLDVGSLGNLPRSLGSFVGRKREIDTVAALFDSHRLVTLTGPGGCGKTRLSLEVGHILVANYPDGVWFVELASVTDPRLVDKTVTTAVGIQERPDRSARDAVIHHFESRTALLILDNCEHLVTACAELIHGVLRTSAGTHVLATSREILSVAGEARFVVPPLDAPLTQSESGASLDAARSSEAVALFVDRAQLAQLGFSVTEENVDAVLGICRRLEGLPLALELAASRIRALTPAQILLRLEDRFRFLTGGTRAQLPHHRTLWASIDWSHEQLEETERALLRRLSVFVGGWSLHAAERACAGPGIEEWEILDAMTRLIDKSMVEIDFTREASTPRYRMLESIREYASTKLEDSGEMRAVRSRFLEYFEAFSKEGAAAMGGPGAPEWLVKTDLDYGNLREAIRLSLHDDESFRYGLATASSLLRYWIRRSHWAEGRSFLAQVLDHPRSTAFPPLRAAALNSAGALAYTAGDYVGSAPLLVEAAQMFEEQGDRLSLGRALMNLGNARSYLSHYDEALELHDRALAIAREADAGWLIAACLTNICNAAEAKGDLDRVEAASKEAAARFHALGDKSGFLMAQNYLAVVAYRSGRYEEAIPYYESSMQIAQELGDRYHGAMMRFHRGLALMMTSRFEEARVDFGTALETAREFDEPMLELTAIDAFVSLAKEEGDFGRALRLVGFVEEQRKQRALPRRQFDAAPFRDQHLQIRGELGAEASDTLEAQGRAFSLDEGITYALRGTLP